MAAIKVGAAEVAHLIVVARAGRCVWAYGCACVTARFGAESIQSQPNPSQQPPRTHAPSPVKLATCIHCRRRAGPESVNSVAVPSTVRSKASRPKRTCVLGAGHGGVRCAAMVLMAAAASLSLSGQRVDHCTARDSWGWRPNATWICSGRAAAASVVASPSSSRRSGGGSGVMLHSG